MIGAPGDHDYFVAQLRYEAGERSLEPIGITGLAPIQMSLNLEAAVQQNIAKLDVGIFADMAHVAEINQLGPLLYRIGAGAAAP